MFIYIIHMHNLCTYVYIFIHFIGKIYNININTYINIKFYVKALKIFTRLTF